MKRGPWAVTLVDWDTYVKTVLKSPEGMWGEFEKADLIFGGVDLSADFLYFLNLILSISYFSN